MLSGRWDRRQSLGSHDKLPFPSRGAAIPLCFVQKVDDEEAPRFEKANDGLYILRAKLFDTLKQADVRPVDLDVKEKNESILDLLCELEGVKI